MADRLKTQAQEIQSILDITGLEPDELAERVFLKPESFRKIWKGYQPASKTLMELLRSIGQQAAAKEISAIFGRSARVREDDPARETISSIEREMAFILRNGSAQDLELLQAQIAASSDVVRRRRRKSASAKSPS